MIKKKTKLIIFIFILIIAFAIFLFLMFKSYNYEKKYTVFKYQIVEKYNKNNKYYNFYISYNKLTFPYIIKSDYFRKKELIIDIEEFTNDNETCILPKSNKLLFYPLCTDGKETYMLNLSNIENMSYNYEDVSVINEEYNNIKINTLADLSFLLFNYRGFYILNSNGYNKINIFDKDIYSMNLVFQDNNMLIIPDYNKDHYFNKFYFINILNGKIKEINTDYDISFDSEFLGSYKNNIYLLDKKEKKEYKINIKKRKVDLVDFQILENGKMIQKTFKEIVNKNLNFLNENIINYVIEDDYLYMVIQNINIKISDKKVSKIIKNDNDTVYYLENDSLYMFNNKYGEILLLSNFEWNFNNTNMIFLS